MSPGKRVQRANKMSLRHLDALFEEKVLGNPVVHGHNTATGEYAPYVRTQILETGPEKGKSLGIRYVRRFTNSHFALSWSWEGVEKMKLGGCGLVHDDHAHWALATDGMQNIDASGEPFDLQTTFIVEKHYFRKTPAHAVVVGCLLAVGVSEEKIKQAEER